MIISMARVRILGPRDRLEEVLESLQDVGLVHLSPPRPGAEVKPVSPSPRQAREVRQLRDALEDIEWVLERLEPDGEGRALPTGRRGAGRAPGPPQFAEWARSARRLRRELEALQDERARLEEERALIDRYRRYRDVFRELLAHEAEWPNARAYHLILRSGAEEGLEGLRAGLREIVGEDFDLLSARLEGGDLAVALVVPRATDRVEELLARAGIRELPVPSGYGDGTLGEVVSGMEVRERELRDRLAEILRRRREISREHAAELGRARAAVRDRLLELEAVERAAETERAFVLEGWLPEEAFGHLERRLADRFGGDLVVERISTEGWTGEGPPVVLSNPRLFRPFEAITGMLPLPAYGSIDPTPFVAVFFPMFFGVILGDVGYGLLLAGLAGLLHRRSEDGTTLRAVAEIAGACAAFTVIFGFLYGELLGDLGRRWFGLQPLAFDREEALVPFLALAVALGLVHILLGLVLGAVEAVRGHHPKESLGRGLAALMVVLIVVALLAAVELLPEAFFTPAVVALLVGFPLLVVLEGVVAPIELLSTLGNILSYARIMALGTASVMMAVVANRLVGALGGALVGVLFGLLFHMVNFVLGIFGPTIHGLRLHYVEFFGKFYSPGGVRYRPFGHWRPGEETAGRAAPGRRPPEGRAGSGAHAGRGDGGGRSGR